MISLIICAIALIVVSFGGGWGAKGWKDGAEVAHEKIMYEGEAFSPSGLANRIASGTARNAWRDLWIKKPRDKEWILEIRLIERQFGIYSA